MMWVSKEKGIFMIHYPQSKHTNNYCNMDFRFWFAYFFNFDNRTRLKGRSLPFFKYSTITTNLGVQLLGTTALKCKSKPYICVVTLFFTGIMVREIFGRQQSPNWKSATYCSYICSIKCGFLLKGNFFFSKKWCDMQILMQ